jgi:hypothetical protein
VVVVVRANVGVGYRTTAACVVLFRDGGFDVWLDLFSNRSDTTRVDKHSLLHLVCLWPPRASAKKKKTPRRS